MQMVMLTILCLVVLLLCGSLLSQGFLESVGDVSTGYTSLASVDKDVMRTSITVDHAYTTGSKIIRLDLTNDGNHKLSEFDQWVVIAEYYGDDGSFHTQWISFTDGMLGFNEWKLADITFNGVTEVFEPGILNSQETLSLNILVNPLPAWDTTTTIFVATPNGIQDSISFLVVPGDFILTPHLETTAIAGDTYYELMEATPADDSGLTLTTGTIGKWVTGRWLLYEDGNPSMSARFVYPLTSTSEIPAYNWNIFYRGYATSGWRDNPYISMDILVRKADGTVREVIGTDVARAYIATFGTWLTISTTYAFPGYAVIDNTDYLEIHYYAGAEGRGSNANSNHIYLRIDDTALGEENQTRIE